MLSDSIETKAKEITTVKCVTVRDSDAITRDNPGKIEENISGKG